MSERVNVSLTTVCGVYKKEKLPQKFKKPKNRGSAVPLYVNDYPLKFDTLLY
jgi:hypothetical protein